MNMDMDMDVAWCLTCSKRTRDPRSPYCSDECRRADQNPLASSSAMPFTSPVPPGLYASPAKSSRQGSVSPHKSPLLRPTLQRAAPTVSPEMTTRPLAEDPVAAVMTGARRDRRAFSFPAQASNDPLPFARRARQSTVLTPATKRTIMSSLTPIDPNTAPDSSRRPTPMNSDSVFHSTSESSDDEASPAPKTTPKQLASAQFSSLRSQLSSGRANSLHSREASHSPVAAFTGSSASSRSREDIISWAKAVGRRDGEADEEVDSRGRSRTRQRLVGSLPRHCEAEEAHEDTGSGLGTTPKGLGSALAGLSMSGVIKAMTSVAAATPRSTKSGDEHDTSLAAQPSAASVSRVAVLAHTNPSLPIEDMLGGGTPTLSTLSVSEVVDPSVQGTHDVDIFTDDGGMSAASSSNFVRRVSMAAQSKAQAQMHAQAQAQAQARPQGAIPPRKAPAAARQTPLPLRPISAIWNMTSYLARFAPFSIPAAILPYAPFAANDPSHPATPAKSGSATPAKAPVVIAPIAAAAGPRSRPDSPDPAQELVRSLPMAILQPPCSTDEDRERERQRQTEQVHRSRMRSSRSRARSHSRSRRVNRSRARRDSLSGSRSSSVGEWAYRKAVMSPEMAVGSTNQDADADADVSENGDGEGGGEDERERGRGRTGRRRGSRAMKIDLGMGKEMETEMEGEASTATETERGRGRGRSRSVRPGVAVRA